MSNKVATRGRVYDFSDLAGTASCVDTRPDSGQIRKIVDPTPIRKGIGVKKRRFGLLTTASIVALVGVASWPLRDHVLVKNFHVVEPGGVYRGAEQKPGPLRRIIEQHGIRTIVCLVDPEPNEQAVAKSLGVEWTWVPLGDSSADITFDRLEELADILADPANRPVFFHCRRGVYRSNLGQAVYRMKQCGWTLAQTLNELRGSGYDPEESGGDQSCAEFLARYERERIRDRAGEKGVLSSDSRSAQFARERTAARIEQSANGRGVFPQ